MGKEFLQWLPGYVVQVLWLENVQVNNGAKPKCLFLFHSSQRHSQSFRDAISTERHLQSRKTGELKNLCLLKTGELCMRMCFFH